MKLGKKIMKDKFASEYFVDRKGEYVNYVVTSDGRLMKVTRDGEKLVGYKEEYDDKKNFPSIKKRKQGWI